MDEVTYTPSTISRLVESGMWKGRHWVDVDGSWADLRSRVEVAGDVQSEAFLEVLDLENAIASLRGVHPEAAMVVIAALFGFGRDECRFIRNYDRLLAKAKAYLTAYLSGEDAEAAYRRGHRRIA